MEVYSIGFGGHTAEEFFEKLASARIERLLDVRLNNRSQLAGFSKRSDLPFFLTRLLGVEYVHDLRLAPTQELLGAYRAKRMPWSEYEAMFLRLMEERAVERAYDPGSFKSRTVLLCSEPTAKRCHRRLVLEYLRATAIPTLVPVHL